MELDELDLRLLDILQTDFPLVPRPYAEMAERLGSTEDEIFARVRRMRQNGLVRSILDMLGIDRKAFMPSYAPKRFRALLKDLRQPKTGRKVALFPGCYVDLYDPQAGLDLVWALNQAGCEVVCPDAFCCCGVPMVASGFMLDAGVNAKRNLLEVKKLKEQGIPVLTACPSCELMFREELPTFFPELVASLQCDSALVDAQEFLLEAESRGELKLDVKPGAGRYLYHAPCHMRALGIGLPGFELLRRFGVDVRPASAGCCGISGSYGFKKEKHEVSMKVGAELFGKPEYIATAKKLADVFERRYFGYDGVYWGGTLDARCEDKEGAMAAFQGYAALLRHAIKAKDAAAERKYARLARHAMNMMLTYTMVWDASYPPGRLSDHAFKSTGWTVVSAQNQHLDAFGVLSTPDIWWMGEYLRDDRFKKLASVMYRACFQLTDASGSLGEQIQHTNFGQYGDTNDIYKLRGGYAETWTVFWLTAHFLNAAAEFREMGVKP